MQENYQSLKKNMFGNHRYYGSRDIIYLFFHVILQLKGHVTILILKVCHQPANFDGHRHCGSGDIMVLFCHVILQSQNPMND